ncbi:MAG TPA: phosphotransferase [Acidimicrobiia bacterium]|nr:phosphotransferase [Acidimicrobiia bacterium]
MTVLGRDHEDDIALFFRSQHRIWTTQKGARKKILASWGIKNFSIGKRIATGEASEVYPVNDKSTKKLLGYLRIAHRGAGSRNGCEVTLMKACDEAGLPSVRLLHSADLSRANGKSPIEGAITFVAPARGMNLQEAILMPGIAQGLIRNAVHNSGIFLAEMHLLRDRDPAVEKMVSKFSYAEASTQLGKFFNKARKTLRRLDETKEQFAAIDDAFLQVWEGLARLYQEYPLVLIHSDLEPKHVFFNINRGELLNVIDFGSAHVNIPHFDLLNWKTFSPETFDEFAQSYLDARFGSDYERASHFMEELDFAETVWQLDWALYRMEHLLVAEACGHVQLAGEACRRIIARDLQPHRDLGHP